ncbi:hypothetical protein ACFW1A_21635 [Kitasatospora sp. NPDC058965]|uniref:hypothetical protein n=1 Tax=Kitasatospora sp. NPDC058965 TaxID=3346682 RepID=UPI00368D2F8F
MPITHPPLSADDLRTLAAHTIAHLPVLHGPWRITEAPRQPGTAVAVEDESRRVLLTVDGQVLAIRPWPVNGTTAPAATPVGRKDPTGRTTALAIARNHLGPQHPAPLNGAQREQQELRAVDAVTAIIPAGVADMAVSRTGRWYTVGWKRRGLTFRVRVDGPQRVQAEVDGLPLDVLSAALGTVLPPSAPAKPPGADGCAASWLINRHPALWYDPLSSASGPDDVLLGPGSGPVTVAVQVPDAPPTDRARGILTVEADLDLALMVLAALS